jgi:hypothetical protein
MALVRRGTAREIFAAPPALLCHPLSRFLRGREHAVIGELADAKELTPFDGHRDTSILTAIESMHTHLFYSDLYTQNLADLAANLKRLKRVTSSRDTLSKDAMRHAAYLTRTGTCMTSRTALLAMAKDWSTSLPAVTPKSAGEGALRIKGRQDGQNHPHTSSRSQQPHLSTLNRRFSTAGRCLSTCATPLPWPLPHF